MNRMMFFMPAGVLMFISTNCLPLLVGVRLPWMFLSLVFLAIGLYGVRTWSRLAYGGLEVLFGFAIMLFALNALGAAQDREWLPIVGGGIFHRRPEGPLLLSGPAIAAFGFVPAIYFVVRGLDNVTAGLRKHPKWSAVWERWAGKE